MTESGTGTGSRTQSGARSWSPSESPSGTRGRTRGRTRGGSRGESQSRSDYYHILLNMHSHSREATGTVTPFDKYAVAVAKRLLCIHSREATVTPFC